jgi:hypothetical protein
MAVSLSHENSCKLQAVAATKAAESRKLKAIRFCALQAANCKPARQSKTQN